MGNRYESELSVAFSLLGIPQGVGPGETAKTHIMFLSSCKNVPPAERTGSPADRRFRWPPNGAPCDSLDRGYTPETVHIDRSAWAEITMRMED
jgi:hypothetical protein